METTWVISLQLQCLSICFAFDVFLIECVENEFLLLVTAMHRSVNLLYVLNTEVTIIGVNIVRNVRESLRTLVFMAIVHHGSLWWFSAMGPNLLLRLLLIRRLHLDLIFLITILCMNGNGWYDSAKWLIPNLLFLLLQRLLNSWCSSVTQILTHVIAT